MIVSGVPTRLIIYQNNTQDINLIGLQDSTGAFVNDATGEATLLDGSRNPDSVFNDLSMVYTSGSNGNYVVTIPGTFEAAVGSEYTTVIDGDANGAHFHLEIPTEVRVRTK
jgi:hypothetical protein